jgi:aerobic carbon-monoxide dehydrogenase medium subunit
VRLPPFELVEPETLAGAVEALARGNGESRLVAGGTALVPMLRLGLLRPARLISLHRIAVLTTLRQDAGTLELGAMVSHATLARSAPVRAGWPLLASAAQQVASPAIRTSATVGGNLCYAEAASDLAPALLCLDAEIRLGGASGDRVVPITRFFRGFYEPALEPGEIVTGVRVPPQPAGARAGYVKYTSRSAEDKPLVGVAALVVLDGASGPARLDDRAGAASAARVADVRLALASAAPTPIRVPGAEARLRGEPLTDATIREAADAAAAEADPLSDLMGSASYRREMIRVWVRRLLTALRDGTAVPRPR